MCDEKQLKTWANELSRRQFGAVAGAGAIAACAPTGTRVADAAASADGLTETEVTFQSADGTMDGLFIHPTGVKRPGVIFWPDIAGIRESKRVMARRLAAEGFAVLVLNPYYRDVAGEQFANFKAFMDADGFQKVRPWRSKFDADTVATDAKAAVAWLDEQDAVETSKGIGAQGYCMTGSFAVWAATAVPDRIKGAASFHGGRLVQEDNPKSPHNLLGKASGSFLIAVAKNDDERAPDVKTKFGDAAQAAGRTATITVYEGNHGWTVPDSPAYDKEAADLAFGDLLKLYRGAL